MIFYTLVAPDRTVSSGASGMTKSNDPSGERATDARRKPDYGIDARTFVIAWEQADTVDQVYEALKAVSEQGGFPVMPKPILLARASLYRSAGIPLKKMRR